MSLRRAGRRSRPRASAARRRPWCGIRWCRACRRSDGRRRAQAAAAASSAASSSLLPISALAAASTSSTVGATAPRPTRAAVQTPSFERQADAGADHGDVHFGARDHAQIGVARTRRARRQGEADEDLAGQQIGAAGTGRHFFDRHSRRPFGPCSVTMAPAATSAGTLSPAGEPLHRLPPAEARPWTWVEPIRLMASSTPGQTFPNRGCSASTAPGDGGADAKAAIGGLLDRGHLGDLLDVDDHARASPRRSASAPANRCRRPGCAPRFRPRQRP